MISEDTRATIEMAEPPEIPEMVPETGFSFNTEPPAATPGGAQPGRRKGGRGKRGPNYERNLKKKGKAPAGPPEPEPSPIAAGPGGPAPAGEPPKTLVRGCRWLLRNVVLMMKEGYGWDEPEDYEEWLQEASPLCASVVQKHFPNWMERWGDEILLIAMLLIWVTPNVGKELRKRRQQADRHGRPEGERKDNEALQLAKSA